MTKIDIISGFLGAGKTTLIRRLLAEALAGEQVVLIENEFGEIGIDGGFLKEAGVQITEMNSGCICCTLVGDFGRALREVIDQYHPDRILIEPSGVGKLSDVISAVQNVAKDTDVALNSFVTVADAQKVKMYAKNFGEFYLNQIESAGAIILSRTQSVKPERLEQAVALLREHNADVRIVTTPWDELTGAQLLAVMEDSHSMAEELLHEMEHHHHHHHEHDEHCDCGCHDHEHEHHHHDEHCDCHEHHHEHHHEHEHEHHHHHEHDEHCTCGCHDHDHHHHDHEHHHHDHHGHHHADEVFMNWGVETARKYTEDEIASMLTAMGDITLGTVLRAKGIVPAADGGWIHFDFVPGAPEIRRGSADYTGRLCVIGCDLDTDRLAEVFEV